jgi:LmbE family N-acetylglucosaminyl deacetylase
MREEELRCAGQALAANSLTIMDYIDPTVGPDDTLFAFTEDIETLADQVYQEIRRWKAGALISHGVNGEYGHPAHKLVYQAAVRAAARMVEEQMDSRSLLFYTVQGIFPGHPHPRLANIDAPAHMVINVAPFLAAKTEAAMCHRTQHALFIRKPSEEAGQRLSVPEVIQPLESLHRVMPPVVPGMLHDALADILWASGCASLPVTG